MCLTGYSWPWLVAFQVTYVRLTSGQRLTGTDSECTSCWKRPAFAGILDHESVPMDRLGNHIHEKVPTPKRQSAYLVLRCKCRRKPLYLLSAIVQISFNA
ncbi:hypothetical protein F5Y02DRAFT_365980 [Annulohypoxylon stygium]|nr:hypothetical protein F5Y02DRAFT_365980 [Annulohypoxylon stygium]